MYVYRLLCIHMLVTHLGIVGGIMQVLCYIVFQLFVQLNSVAWLCALHITEYSLCITTSVYVRMYKL